MSFSIPLMLNVFLYAAAIGDMEKDIQHLADLLHKDEVITDDIRQFAIRRSTKPACYYLLPKVQWRTGCTTSMPLRKDTGVFRGFGRFLTSCFIGLKCHNDALYLSYMCMYIYMCVFIYIVYFILFQSL